jgi:anti-anti-sigma factor
MNGPAEHPSLTLTEEPGAAVLTARGDLDYFTASGFADRIADAIALGRARTVLDLAGVGFCDSVGVSVLLQARQRAQRAGTVLVMRGVRATVVRVLDIAGLTAVLPVDGGREGVRSAAT